MRGIMLLGARTTAFRAEARAALDKARECAQTAPDGISRREQKYIDALQHAYDGELAASSECYAAILEDNPTDLLALVFLQSELFWLGEMAWSARVSAKLVSHWNATVPGYAAFLAVRAFDLEETNEFAEAEHVAREALENEPGEVWGAHALAHVMLMQNRIDEGIAWMGEREQLWDSANQMQFHLAWHQCLFLAERRAHSDMLRIYDSRIRNRQHPLCDALPDLYIDLQNGASLLWRLEHAGVDVGNRWEELAEVVSPRVEDMSSPFTSAHFALVLAATQRFEQCEDLIKAMEAFSTDATHDLAPRYQKAAIPAAKAALAHRRGDHAQVLAMLKPAQEHLISMGGSHAQQELFFQLLADSTAQTGDASGHSTLLSSIERMGFIDAAQRAGYRLQAAVS